jgi:hypothetical protein
LVPGFIGHLTLVTTNNYDSITELHTPKDHCNCSIHEVFSVSNSCCLVAASNGRPSSGFPNCCRPQVPDSHFLQLQLSIDCLRRNNASTELFPNNGCCSVACLHSSYLAMGLHVTTYSVHYENKGASSSVSDVDRYVTGLHFQHTSGIHALMGNSSGLL